MKKYYILLISLFIFMMSNAQSPGGFGSTNMNLWVKANTGTSCSGNGCSINTWTDQSGSGNNGTQTGTGRPTYQTVSTNYNPGINIVGNTAPKQHFLLPNSTIPAGGSDYTVIYVANRVTSTGFVLAGGINSNHSANRFRIDANGGTKSSWQNSSSDLETPANANLAGKRVLYTNNYNSGGGSRTTFLQTLDAGSNTSTSINTSSSNNKIGLREDGGGALIGNINEILVYSYSLSALNQSKAETYLALKYGITQDNSGGGTNGDYIATDGTNIWDASVNAGHHNDVIGLGRDDNEDLYQKQSHSFDDTTRIYLNTLTATNIANTGNLSSDVSYVLLGHNQGVMHAIPTATAEVPTGLTGCAIAHRIEREWKVTKTNITEDFSWDVTLNNPASNPTSVNVAHLRLLIDDDGNFSNGGTSCYYNGDGTGLTISYSNPIITFSGISTTHIPNNSTRYMAIASINSLTPLPVEMIAFDATCNDRTPKLEWTTASETNNDYFTIERSEDAINFEVVETITGKGNSVNATNYSWIDNNPLNETAYYRLKQTDFNGDHKYHKAISIDCNAANDVLIYPNPFQGYFTIQLPNNIVYPINLEIMDYLGRTVHRQIIKSNVVSIVTDKLFRKGTYNVRIYNESTLINTRLIKAAE